MKSFASLILVFVLVVAIEANFQGGAPPMKGKFDTREIKDTECGTFNFTLNVFPYWAVLYRSSSIMVYSISQPKFILQGFYSISAGIFNATLSYDGQSDLASSVLALTSDPNNNVGSSYLYSPNGVSCYWSLTYQCEEDCATAIQNCGVCNK